MLHRLAVLLWTVVGLLGLYVLGLTWHVVNPNVLG